MLRSPAAVLGSPVLTKCVIHNQSQSSSSWTGLIGLSRITTCVRPCHIDRKKLVANASGESVSPLQRDCRFFTKASITCSTSSPSPLSVQSWSRFKSSSGTDEPSFLASLFLPAAAFFSFFKSGQDEDELSPEDRILMDIKRAILAIKRDQIEKAERFLKKALTESQHEKLDPAITQILDIQANLSLHKGELAKAQELFKTVVQRLIGLQGYQRSDNAVIEISLKLAQIFEHFGQLEEAMSGYQYCIDVQREKIEKDEFGEDEELKLNTLLLMAWASHNLAQIHMKISISRGVPESQTTEHIETAKKLSSEAYQYTEMAEGPDSEHAIAIKSDLASIKALTGDIEGALSSLLEVEQIAKEKYIDLYPSVSVNIANLYLQKGSYDEAERICKSAKVFAGKIKDVETFARAQECVLKCAKLQQEENGGGSSGATSRSNLNLLQ